MTIAKGMGAFRVTLAMAGALLVAGCPPKGFNLANLRISPWIPAAGDTLTLMLDRGHYPLQDGLYAVTLSRPPEITPENPTPSQPPDAGVKLGDMVVVNGHGEFQTVLQPTYGPDKYGTIFTLEPGTHFDLGIRGPNLSMKRGLPIGIKQDAPSPGASPPP